MRAILVDDEPLALVHLRQQINRIGGIRIEAECTRVDDALAQAEALRPDVVFLDIEMPELDGFEAAERLHRAQPEISVVFVTAYHSFALRAFEANAVDYLLKPVELDRLRLTVQRLSRFATGAAKPAAEPAVSSVEAAPAAPSTQIRCLQYFRVEGADLAWRTGKARELFAYMVHRRGEPLRKDMLVELLWPDLDAKKGYTQLYSAIYQIRKTVANTGISVESTMDGYRLDLGGVPVDVEQWEQSLHAAPPLAPDTEAVHWRLFDMYRGDYLAEYDYLWAESERERLRALWYRHALELGTFLGASGAHERAVQINSRILERFPFCEEIYRQLVQNYYALGDRQSALRYYEKWKILLQEEVEVPSNADFVHWTGLLRAE